jgi:hypothetical protein
VRDVLALELPSERQRASLRVASGFPTSRRHCHLSASKILKPILKLSDVEIASDVMSEDFSFVDEDLNQTHRVRWGKGALLSFAMHDSSAKAS